MKATKLFLALVSALVLCASAFASEGPIQLSLKDHKFTPVEIHVKANVVNVITLSNNDGLAEEFDSTSLKVEKVVAGNSSGIIRVRPLEPGRYPFMGEYHAGTAQGVVIAE